MEKVLMKFLIMKLMEQKLILQLAISNYLTI
jgi:hypothetical protein